MPRNLDEKKFYDILELIKQTKDSQAIHELVMQVTYQTTFLVERWPSPYFYCDLVESAPEVSIARKDMHAIENSLVSTCLDGRNDDYVHLYEFMFLMVDMGIQTFDLPKFESIIKASNDPKLMHYVIGYVPGINVLEMLEALYATRCLKHIEAVTHFDGVSETPEEVLENARAHQYFPECLKTIIDYDAQESINFIELQSLVLYYGTPVQITALAEYFGQQEGVDLPELERAIIETDEPLHIYEFAASVPGANIGILEEAIIQKGMVKYMYYMLAYVKGVDIVKMAQAIANAKTPKYLEKAIEHLQSEDAAEIDAEVKETAMAILEEAQKKAQLKP